MTVDIITRIDTVLADPHQCANPDCATGDHPLSWLDETYCSYRCRATVLGYQEYVSARISGLADSQAVQPCTNGPCCHHAGHEGDHESFEENFRRVRDALREGALADRLVTVLPARAPSLVGATVETTVDGKRWIYQGDAWVARVRSLRCLLGIHAWMEDLTCRRCGKATTP